MEEHKKEDLQEKIDLTRILNNFMYVAKRLWILVPVLALALGGYRYWQARRNYTPLYTASATFSVSSGIDSATDILSGTNFYDSQAAQQVVDSFPYIIRSEAMTERIRETLGTEYVNGSINQPQVIGDSNFYVLSVSSRDPQSALDILNAVIENYPQVASFVVGNTRLSMIEEPILPIVPTNYFTGRGVALKGAIMGGALACGFIFLLSLGRSTVMKAEDLQKEISLRYMGSVPLVQVKRRRKNTGRGLSLLNDSVRRQLGDAVGNVRVKLLRELEESGDHMILVTSTLPGEGKTTVAFNLALSLAQSGRSVILVDADLRNQSVKERFRIREKTKGLAELLEEDDPNVEEALLLIRGSSLRLLAGNTKITSAMDLVDSPKMKDLLDRLRPLAEYVIIDAPPAGILGDAAVLGRYADKTLYVVRYDTVPKRQVVDSILGLSRRNVALCGYVLNGQHQSRQSYGKYGYGYGKSRK